MPASAGCAEILGSRSSDCDEPAGLIELCGIVIGDDMCGNDIDGRMAVRVVIALVRLTTEGW